MGFNLYGEERCRLPGGCTEPPAPRLSRADQVAWFVFRASASCWNWFGGGLGGGGRTGLRYSDVRVVAEAYGFALNAPLLVRIQRLEMLTLADDAKRRDIEARQRRQDDDEARVN
jgi:hypothetical protein